MKPSALPAFIALSVFLLLGALVIACGGNGGSGGNGSPDVPDDPIGLIPVDADMVIVFDVSEIQGSSVPRDVERDFEDWAEDLLDGDIDLDDIDTLVVVGDSLLIARGDFDFDQVRDNLEDIGYEDDEYRGFETWGERAALIEQGNYVILGFASGAVQDFLRSLDRGRGLLAFEQDNNLSLLVEDISSGPWIVFRADNCPDVPSAGCDGSGVSYTFPEDDSSTMRVRSLFIFEDEEASEDALVELEDSLLEDGDLEVLDARTADNTLILEFDLFFDLSGFLYALVEGGPVASRQGTYAQLAAAPTVPQMAPTEPPAVAAAAPAPTAAIIGGNLEDARRIRPGEEASGRLGSSEEHFFEFNAQRGRTYVIETDAQFDSYIELYDEFGGYLASDDDSGSGASSLIQWTASSSGAHFVLVRGFGGSDAGSYDLIVTELEADDDAGRFDDATRIGSGDRLDGNITSGGEDYFVFDARRGRAYIFETHARFDTVIELYDESGYDESGYEIGYDDDGGEDGASRLSWTADSSGNHYLMVRGYGSSDSGRYELSMTGVDPDDHGCSRRDATRIGSNDEADGTILEGDADYFTFDARRGRTYTIETEADFDTVIALLDDRGDEIAYDDDGGRDSASRLEWEAPSSGEYFVVVGGFDSFSIGIYRLLISESR